MNRSSRTIVCCGPAESSPIGRLVVASLWLAIVWIVTCALAVSAPAAEPVSDIGELRRQITTGEIAGEVPAGTFITARYDDYGWVSWQVAALKDQPPTTPLVVIVGGSAVRECVSDDGGLAALIADKSDTEVEVVSLATMMQRLPSTLAIIDNLPRGSGVVIIGVHHPTFAATQEDAQNQLSGSPLLMTSAAVRKVTVDEFGGDPPLNILPGLQTYLDTYERRRPRPPFTGIEMEYFRHRYDSKGALPLETKQRIVPRFSQGLGAPGGAFDTYFDYNVALLTRCVSLARDKGYQVLLMQDPMDTTATGDAFAGYEARYDPEVKQIVKNEGAHYADLNTSAGLVDGDFFDLYHLLSSGRAKWTPALAGTVATILEDHPPGSQAGPSPHGTETSVQVAVVAASKSPKPKASKSAKTGTKSDKKKAAQNQAEDDGGWPWWQTIAVVLVALVLILAVLRRRAVVRRRRRARARARRRRSSDTAVTAVTLGAALSPEVSASRASPPPQAEPWWAEVSQARRPEGDATSRREPGRTFSPPPVADPDEAETGTWNVIDLDD